MFRYFLVTPATALLIFMQTSAAQGDDFIQLNRWTPFGTFIICKNVEAARRQRDLTNDLAERKVISTDPAVTVAKPDCFPLNVRVNPSAEQGSIPRGQGWSKVFDPNSEYNCDICPVDGDTCSRDTAIFVKCGFVIQEMRYYWAQIADGEGHFADAIVEIFQTQIEAQYLESLGKKSP